jgi:hypothetical protein
LELKPFTFKVMVEKGLLIPMFLLLFFQVEEQRKMHALLPTMCYKRKSNEPINAQNAEKTLTNIENVNWQLF